MRHDIPAIGLWRDRVAEAGLARGGGGGPRRRAARVQPVPGRLLHPRRPAGGAAALADNRAAIAEAAELGADTLVLVCGGLVPGSRDLGLARRMVADAIADLVPSRAAAGRPARHRGAAPDVLRRPVRDVPAGRGGRPGPAVPGGHRRRGGGHLPRLVGRAAGRRDRPGPRPDRQLPACDWIAAAAADTLLGRGHVGDGCIDFGPDHGQVLAAGYAGYVEVEIFKPQVWDAPPDETAATVRERFAAVLGRVA